MRARMSATLSAPSRPGQVVELAARNGLGNLPLGKEFEEKHG